MTSISWTGETWNPIVGCSVVSPGCTNCYAMRMANRLGAMRNTPHYHGLTRKVNGNPVWTGRIAAAPQRAFLAPLRRRIPTTYFVNSMGDLFHEQVPIEQIDQVFAVMALCPQHTFQILTKRPDRMQEYMIGTDENGRWPALDHAAVMAATGQWNTPALDLRDGWPLPNVWLGTSVENQATADQRIPALLGTPAAKRFISAEPLLGPVDMTPFSYCTDSPGYGLDWVICGGESGPGARPMHPDWARALRDQCAAAGTPFFFKQWGDWAPVTLTADEDGELNAAYPVPGCSDGAAHNSEQECRFWQRDAWMHWPYVDDLPAVGARRIGKKAAGRLLDGIEHNAMPDGAGGAA